MIDLVSERVGGRIVACNDEFFAPAANLIAATTPVANDEYTDRGKWMDGWETRRRREPGHDWVTIRLGIPGRIRRASIDTSHFTGNYPERVSLDAAGTADPDDREWSQIIPPSDLTGDSVAKFEIDYPSRVEIVRLNIYPDGGVARLRLEGDPIPPMQLVCPGGEIDMALASVGGEVVDASDLHYSHPSNILRPGESEGMWDGWETRRRRDDGHDWVIVRFGLSGSVERLQVDTSHFKGNAPGWVSAELSDDGIGWKRIVDRARVGADQVNTVDMGGAHGSHLRLSLHPDGGIARLRVLGAPDVESAGEARLEYVNALFPRPADHFFATACASRAWIDGMTSRLPFDSVSAILGEAEIVFGGLGEDDWLEAFAAHPRIGERGDDTANREQSGTSSASRETIRELIEVNRRYEEKFGFTYIVYATGKTAEQMLAIARERLDNDRAGEIANAAAEQRKITHTRLRRMLCQEVA